MTRTAPRFELDPRAPPARAAHTVALAQLDYALAGLERGGTQAVHEARKVCKKLRALLRLIRPFLGTAYRAENRRLRDAGRALAQGREAAVLVETANALFGREQDGLRQVAQRVRAWPRPEAGVSFREARQLLRIERRRTGKWAIRKLSAGSLIAGWLAGYRRARRRYRSTHRRPTSLALHEWRKQAKYHGYQSALVAPLWPKTRARIAPLRKLSDLLGWHHDLTVLSQTLSLHTDEFSNRETLRAARRRIAAEQARAARKALKLGKRLFARRPLAWFASPITV